MQVICTDGTTFTCKGYELTEYGAVIYNQKLDPENERYAGDPEQAGYVPHDRLWYILPDGVEPSVAGVTAAQGQPTQQSQPNIQPLSAGQPQASAGRTHGTTNQPQGTAGQSRPAPGQNPR